MEISKLKAFVVVAEELNFRKSAERLAMSQPPLTRLIASLEDELGTRLFERTTRKVRLTGAGVVLLKEARDILFALNQMESRVRATGKIKGGVLKVGISMTAFLARFPSTFEAFRERFPKVEVDFKQHATNRILEEVRNGKSDLGFVDGISSAEGLEGLQIHEERLGVLLPKGHPLAHRKEIHFSDLRDETIILHHRQEAQEFHDRVRHLIQGMPKKPKVYIRQEGESCPFLVAVGKGVSLTIAGLEKAMHTHTRFVPIREMFLPVSVFWRADNSNPSLRTFLSFMSEASAIGPKETHCLSLTRRLQIL